MKFIYTLSTLAAVLAVSASAIPSNCGSSGSACAPVPAPAPVPTKKPCEKPTAPVCTGKSCSDNKKPAVIPVAPVPATGGGGCSGSSCNKKPSNVKPPCPGTPTPTPTSTPAPTPCPSKKAPTGCTGSNPTAPGCNDSADEKKEVDAKGADGDNEKEDSSTTTTTTTDGEAKKEDGAEKPADAKAEKDTKAGNNGFIISSSMLSTMCSAFIIGAVAVVAF